MDRCHKANTAVLIYKVFLFGTEIVQLNLIENLIKENKSRMRDTFRLFSKPHFILTSKQPSIGQRLFLLNFFQWESLPDDKYHHSY